jgi:hypothetical protein
MIPKEETKIGMLRKLRYLTIIVFMPSAISFILLKLGRMSLEHMIIINIVVTIIETILFVIGMRIIAKDLTGPGSQLLILKGKFNDKYIKGNTDIFDRLIIPTNPMKDCMFRICIELADRFIGPSLELLVIRKCEACTCEQKVDASHCKEGSHALHINIDPREKLNFKFNKDIKVKLFSVEELYMP